MKFLFLGYPQCSTSKKAKKWLDEAGISYEERNIAHQNPTEKELAAWIDISGLPLKRFFNTSGQVYKKMGLKNSLPHLTKEEQIKLLSSDGMLVKRPILVGEGLVLVGFDQEEWEVLKI